MTVVEGAEGLDFGLLLRRCRIAAGMTQEELAGASGLSVRAIGDLERGRTRRPQRRSVELLAEALAPGAETARQLAEAAMAARLGYGEALPRPEAGAAGLCELPPDVVDFTGREREARRLEAALGGGRLMVAGPGPAGPRPVLVEGQPGAGKTALAVHAAHRCRARFPDGQVFVELAPAGAPALGPVEVVRRVLRSLGAADPEPAGLEEAAARLRAVLARRRVLVVLDDAVSEAQVRWVCPAVGGSAVLATCRRRLSGLAGAEAVTVAAFRPHESLAFLARMLGEERVSAAGPDASVVAGLCGHLPLALRAVGCRLLARPHWTMRTLLEEVLADPRTRLREMGSGDVTVRASMARAFALLDERARAALWRLATARPPGWFTPATAAGLLGCGQARAHRLLGDLMDGHLLEVAEERRPGEPRCRVPVMVRLFAAEGAWSVPAGASAAAGRGGVRRAAVPGAPARTPAVAVGGEACQRVV
ncbi:hypothetical protein GCM10010218_10130 [Streptomyces mashuensis]|uniref:HTH cro/C1-type domain-containing protein n=1 Tax=Streptomyces mashuensis TaxID=33904 RepID=A0A919AZJ5_9ACTN|nr:helix-turn-helix domain-containing protein [Streptomyces mashuensis]GHF30802.1 hypothetical protein GCM10010218_10130 [Streptomyces mashuensis]